MGGEGQADAALSKAHGGQSGIHGDWVDLGKQGVHQRQKLALQGGRPCHIPGEEPVAKGLGLPGTTLDSTEMQPEPPMERTGTIWSSLPE